MKKILVFFIVISLAGLGTLYGIKLSGKYRNTDTVMNRAVLMFFNCNNITVQGQELQNVTIKWKADFDSSTIYQDGKSMGNVKNTYGPQRFEIFYKNKLFCEVSQFKYAWWYTYDYHFTISSINNILRCSATIVGPDTQYKIYDK